MNIEILVQIVVSHVFKLPYSMHNNRAGGVSSCVHVLSALSVLDVVVCCHVLSALSVLDVAVGAWCLQGVCRCSWTAGCMWLTRVTTATLQASLAYLLCLHTTSHLFIHIYIIA